MTRTDLNADVGEIPQNLVDGTEEAIMSQVMTMPDIEKLWDTEQVENEMLRLIRSPVVRSLDI